MKFSDFLQIITERYISSTPISNSATTFEFFVEDGVVYAIINRKKGKLKDLLVSNKGKEYRDALRKIYEEIVFKYNNFPAIHDMVRSGDAWEKVIVKFITHYWDKYDQKLDAIVRTNGTVNINLERQPT